jgi:hypothetical protein
MRTEVSALSEQVLWDQPRDGHAPVFAIATNVLRNQRRSLRRRREAFERLPVERTEEPDFAGWSGLPYEDAAVALDIPIGTVRSRLARGRRRLRELTSTGGPEGDVDVVPLRIEVHEP